MLALAVSGTMAMADNIHGIKMDFQAIGDAGNAADGTGYGAVGYDYRIGRTEVTLSQFQAATGAGNGNENSWSALGVSNAPAVKISFVEAARFCNFMTSGDVASGAYTISGGQVTNVTAHSGASMDALVSTYGQVYLLPTEDEWYKAAYYGTGSYSTYANGTSTIPTQGADANYDGTAAWAVESGAVEQNGTKNMMGNVWEWTESAYDGTLNLPVAEDIAFRGGAYNNLGTLLSSASRAQDAYSLEHQSVGMRVVAVPEPGTISLMSLSTVGLFLTRTMRRRKRLGLSLIPIRGRACDDFKSADDMPYDYERVDLIQIVGSTAKDGCERVKTSVANSRRELDKAFWNWVVVCLERFETRSEAVRESAVKHLDTLLAKIMK